MKIAAHPFSFTETAQSSAGHSKSGQDYGKGFETAIRSAAKEHSNGAAQKSGSASKADSRADNEPNSGVDDNAKVMGDPSEATKGKTGVATTAAVEAMSGADVATAERAGKSTPSRADTASGARTGTLAKSSDPESSRASAIPVPAAKVDVTGATLPALPARAESTAAGDLLGRLLTGDAAATGPVAPRGAPDSGEPNVPAPAAAKPDRSTVELPNRQAAARAAAAFGAAAAAVLGRSDVRGDARAEKVETRDATTGRDGNDAPAPSATLPEPTAASAATNPLAHLQTQIPTPAERQPDGGEPASPETETVLEERIVVVTLDRGVVEAGDEDGSARGKVRLEVLHMETHFEPRSDAVVLVEGKPANGAAIADAANPSPTIAGTGSPGAPAKRQVAGEGDPLFAASTLGAAVETPPAEDATIGVRLSFDEALARLGKRQTAPGLRDTVARREPATPAVTPSAGEARRAEGRILPVENRSLGAAAGREAPRTDDGKSVPSAARSREPSRSQPTGLDPDRTESPKTSPLTSVVQSKVVIDGAAAEAPSSRPVGDRVASAEARTAAELGAGSAVRTDVEAQVAADGAVMAKSVARSAESAGLRTSQLPADPNGGQTAVSSHPPSSQNAAVATEVAKARTVESAPSAANDSAATRSPTAKQFETAEPVLPAGAELGSSVAPEPPAAGTTTKPRAIEAGEPKAVVTTAKPRAAAADQASPVMRAEVKPVAAGEPPVAATAEAGFAESDEPAGLAPVESGLGAAGEAPVVATVEVGPAEIDQPIRAATINSAPDVADEPKTAMPAEAIPAVTDDLAAAGTIVLGDRAEADAAVSLTIPPRPRKEDAPLATSARQPGPIAGGEPSATQSRPVVAERLPVSATADEKPVVMDKPAMPAAATPQGAAEPRQTAENSTREVIAPVSAASGEHVADVPLESAPPAADAVAPAPAPARSTDAPVFAATAGDDAPAPKERPAAMASVEVESHAPSSNGPMPAIEADFLPQRVAGMATAETAPISATPDGSPAASAILETPAASVKESAFAPNVVDGAPRRDDPAKALDAKPQSTEALREAANGRPASESRSTPTAPSSATTEPVGPDAKRPTTPASETPRPASHVDKAAAALTSAGLSRGDAARAAASPTAPSSATTEPVGPDAERPTTPASETPRPASHVDKAAAALTSAGLSRGDAARAAASPTAPSSATTEPVGPDAERPTTPASETPRPASHVDKAAAALTSAGLSRGAAASISPARAEAREGQAAASASTGDRTVVAEHLSVQSPPERDGPSPVRDRSLPAKGEPLPERNGHVTASADGAPAGAPPPPPLPSTSVPRTAGAGIVSPGAAEPFGRGVPSEADSALTDKADSASRTAGVGIVSPGAAEPVVRGVPSEAASALTDKADSASRTAGAGIVGPGAAEPVGRGVPSEAASALTDKAERSIARAPAPVAEPKADIAVPIPAAPAVLASAPRMPGLVPSTRASASTVSNAWKAEHSAQGAAKGAASRDDADAPAADHQDGVRFQPSKSDPRPLTQTAQGDADARQAPAPSKNPAQPRSDAGRSEAKASTLAAAADVDAPEPTATLASMTGQVAGRIVDALGSSTSASSSAGAPQGETYLRMTAGGAALKTLTIQLQPENLGRLDVSMRLVDGQLTLELAATEAATAKVLAEDREGLRKLLQHAGFAIDEASITIVTRDASAAQPLRADSASGSASGGRQDGAASQNPGSGSQPGERDGRDSSSPRQDESRQDRRRASADETRQARAKAASTYL